jgi:hypothetical protein
LVLLRFLFFSLQVSVQFDFASSILFILQASFLCCSS